MQNIYKLPPCAQLNLVLFNKKKRLSTFFYILFKKEIPLFLKCWFPFPTNKELQIAPYIEYKFWIRISYLWWMETFIKCAFGAKQWKKENLFNIFSFSSLLWLSGVSHYLSHMVWVIDYEVNKWMKRVNFNALLMLMCVCVCVNETIEILSLK